jgi:hypothetical protein
MKKSQIVKQWRKVLPGLMVLALGMEAEPVAVGFEDVSLSGPAVQVYSGAGGGVYYNGADLSGGFTSGGVNFLNEFSDFGDFGAFWTGGWGYSTTVDTETAGFLNDFSAYPGSAREGTVYGLATALPASIEFPVGRKAPISISVTNTTYAALSMLNGDDFAKKFETGDYFKLTVSGLDNGGTVVGSLEVYLADFRPEAGEGYILDTWLDIDLSSLGTGISELSFALESTDTGDFGMNTPSYIAVDNLILDSTPTWGGYDMEAGGWVNTGEFLGWVYPIGSYVYVLSLDSYAVIPEPPMESGEGVWVYFPR